MLKKVVSFFMIIATSIILAGTTGTGSASTSTTPSLQAMVHIDNQVQCLAKNIYFEAATQSTAGKLAVAFVTKNRVDSRNYPNSFCDVIYEGPTHASGLPKKDRCQFSWYCDGNLDVPYKGKQWKNSQNIAQWFYYNKDRILDITDGATHYHADWMEKYPKWSKKYVKKVTIDQHIFYKQSYKRL